MVGGQISSMACSGLSWHIIFRQGRSRPGTPSLRYLARVCHSVDALIRLERSADLAVARRAMLERTQTNRATIVPP